MLFDSISQWSWPTVLLEHNVFVLTTQFPVWKCRPSPLKPYLSCGLGAYVYLARLSSRLRISLDAESSPALLSLPCSLWHSSPSVTSIARSRTGYFRPSTSFTMSRLPARTFWSSYSSRRQSALKPGSYVQTIPWQLIFIKHSATTSTLLSGLPYVVRVALPTIHSWSWYGPNYRTNFISTSNFSYRHKLFLIFRHIGYYSIAMINSNSTIISIVNCYTPKQVILKAQAATIFNFAHFFYCTCIFLDLWQHTDWFLRPSLVCFVSLLLVIITCLPVKAPLRTTEDSLTICVLLFDAPLRMFLPYTCSSQKFGTFLVAVKFLFLPESSCWIFYFESLWFAQWYSQWINWLHQAAISMSTFKFSPTTQSLFCVKILFESPALFCI